MMKIYIKAPVKLKSAAGASLKTPAGSQKWLSLGLIGLGTFVLVWVVAPIVSYELVEAPVLKQPQFISPVKSTAAVAAAQDIDYTQVSTWFPAAPPQVKVSQITHYTVDIPKLNITNAVVTIGGEDLKQSLIQYGGTANPGEWGTPVIFGHSILRQFYNPIETNPGRYVSIFSMLMTLEPGDKIGVNYDGIKYTYRVTKKYQVEPEDVEVLAQYYDQKLLRLITCVPEGTYLHRGVVEAVLEPI